MRIAPHFYDELAKAGLVPVVDKWYPETGEVVYRDGASEKSKNEVAALLEVHDPNPRVAKTIQWAVTKLVNSNTSEPLVPPNNFTWATEAFPYTVPQGYWLGITDVQFGSKMTDGSPGAAGSTPRASFFVINNVLTVPDNHGSLHFKTPFVIPPGRTLTANFINNDNEAQWMTALVCGRLVPKTSDNYGDAFAGSF